MDIIKLTQIGEGKTLEYKRNTDSLDSILKSVIAFANTAGGIILIGVDDDGSIVGINDAGKIQEQLASSISDRIRPQIIPDISTVEIDGKKIVFVQIEHIQGAHYLNDKGLEKGAYIRIGNANHLAGPEVITELKRISHYTSFDKSPCDNLNEFHLDLNRIKSIFSGRGRDIEVEKLMSLGVLVRKGKRIVATNGGVILFGLPNIREMYFPYAEVRCARFKGISKAEFIDRLNIDGGILSAIEEVPKFIRRNTKMAGKFGKMQRQDIPEYPVEGIREALTNALAHANYEITGSRIFVAIYDDRLEIQNPGIMPPGMSIEQFKAGVSRIRNPVIARILGELDLIEEWGSGYKRIKDACEKGGYPLPAWEEFSSALRVTFYPHPEFIQELQLGAESGTKLAPSWHQAETIELDEIEREIIKFCTEPKSLRDVLKYMKFTDRTKFANRYIIPLLEKGLLKMTIPGKAKSPNQKYVTTELGLKFFMNINH